MHLFHLNSSLAENLSDPPELLDLNALPSRSDQFSFRTM